MTKRVQSVFKWLRNTEKRLIQFKENYLKKILIKFKKPAEIIKNIFVKTVVINTKPKKAAQLMKKMIESYQDLIKEYNQHKEYYLSLIQVFKEVISIVN